VTYIEAIVLGLIQGLTEFIPISSSAHLRIVPEFFGWEDTGAATTAVIQLGTLLAVLIYFAKDLALITRGFFVGLARRQPFAIPESRLAWYLIFATIPVGVLGLAFKDFIEGGARNMWINASALIGAAILLIAAERYSKRRATLKTEDDVKLADAMWIGGGQALALIPGMSRSGSTIMVSLFRGLTHSAAARFSFLLSIPAIAASGIFELVAEWDHLAELGWGPIIVATFVSFLSGWASIFFLIRYLKTHTTAIFIYYRIAFGALIMVLLAMGVLKP
jgi:undecaprenyl-diphosphatase